MINKINGLNVLRLTALVGLPCLFLLFSLAPHVGTQEVKAASDKSAKLDGKAIAFNRKKGNCLACHNVPGGSLPGNIGPTLKDMKKRFPTRKALRDQIWDPTKANPQSLMPPFGKHGILSVDELEAVVDFIYSL